MNNIDNEAHGLRHGDFRHWDLNLLVAFDALMREGGHVSRAATRLFIGQPAMSHALARLRELLDDPLFVRSGTRMQPTPRAQALAPQVTGWLQDAQALLSPQQAFDPARAEATLRITIPEHFELLWLPPLLTRLRREAPGIRIRSAVLPLDRLLAALDNDEIDLAIAGAPLAMRSWHRCEWQMDAYFDIVYNPALLNLPRPASLADLAACAHIATSYVGDDTSMIDRFFAEHGYRRDKVATSAGLAAIPQVVSGVPLVSVLPELVTMFYRELPDIVIEPFERETLRIPVNMVWHHRLDSTPAHRYLRGLIGDISREIEARL